jgi:hypothetical protein
MNDTKQAKSGIRVMPYVLATMAVLAIPLLGMIVSDDFNWGIFDFVVIGLLLFGAGMIYEHTSKKLKNKDHIFIAAVVTVTLVLYLWAELAVGIFTNWGS